jgi:cytochrome c biogenesis protein CcmG, thiol:disulfide interchange protein DsbE
MKRFLIPGLVVAAAVALIALLTYGVTNHSDTGSIDARVASGHFPLAPNYTKPLPLLGTDRTASLSSFHGKVVLVNVYASWCEPCRSEAPLMAREQRVLSAHGAQLVGISDMDSSASTEKFNRQYGLHYPVLRDVSSQFVHSLGTYQVPETFVLSPVGRIEAVQRSSVDAAWLRQHVTPLLQRQS